jgi:hypothetical protein
VEFIILRLESSTLLLIDKGELLFFVTTLGFLNIIWDIGSMVGGGDDTTKYKIENRV